MDSIKDRAIISAENDPDFQALVKMGRRTNLSSMIFWGLSFLSFPILTIPSVVIAVALLANPTEKGVFLPPLVQLATYLPLLFMLFAFLSEEIGERILDWKDKCGAQKQTKELLSRLVYKK